MFSSIIDRSFKTLTRFYVDDAVSPQNKIHVRENWVSVVDFMIAMLPIPTKRAGMTYRVLQSMLYLFVVRTLDDTPDCL